jgi:hypothetical protein
MRSSGFIKIVLAGFGASLLGGCLLSETPILDAANGRATPIKPGAYIACPLKDDADASDCDELIISHDASGLYRFEKADEKPSLFRFRKIAWRGYAVQTTEDGDDSYMYYYGRRIGKRFRLTMMMCAELPASLRDALIANGDLASEDDDFESCMVNTLEGLTKAAKAYHHGDAVSGVVDGETMVLELTPATQASE